MEQGNNTTYVAYTLVSAGGPVRLTAAAIADNRVFHNTGQVAWPVKLEQLPDGVRVTSTDPGAPALVVRMASAAVTVTAELFQGFELPAEAERGLRDTDDHVHVATFSATIAPGGTVVVLASSQPDADFDARSLERRRARDRTLLDRWREARPAKAEAAPVWVEQLVLAADQFVVDRPSPDAPDGKSVIAGYHWFGDWGRDTMVSLPGLTLVTGRPEIAAPILETFARFVNEGMLPNRFPDAGDQPEYNTIDATLWYFQAIRAYHDATGDDVLLGQLYPVLQDIVDWHLKGTRYGIQVDVTDGLLRWDHDGVQLTWMDAKVGDHVITPRRGKPVEVNALWYNAVRAMAAFARRLGRDAAQYDKLGDATLAGFGRFWNPAAGYCYDVLDGPDGHEASLRPNQIFAVSLPESPLAPNRQRAVVDACARSLLTSYGLRSLAATESAYVGFYGGDQAHRDGAYHQGTVWAWLIGPYIDALLRVEQDVTAARRLLEPFGDHLAAAGTGTISEIFDGDDPLVARGCIAQAWSVAEVLRAFDRIEQPAPKP
jgi:predicted glycogen debranching enzyme